MSVPEIYPPKDREHYAPDDDTDSRMQWSYTASHHCVRKEGERRPKRSGELG